MALGDRGLFESLEVERPPLKPELRIIGRGAAPMRSIKQPMVFKSEVVSNAIEEEPVPRASILVSGKSDRMHQARIPLVRATTRNLKHELVVIDRPTVPMWSLARERLADEQPSLAERARARLMLQRRVSVPANPIARPMVTRQPETKTESIGLASKPVNLKPALRIQLSVTSSLNPDHETITEPPSKEATVALSTPDKALGAIALILERSKRSGEPVETLAEPAAASVSEAGPEEITPVVPPAPITDAPVPMSMQSLVSGEKELAESKPKSRWPFGLGRLFGR